MNEETANDIKKAIEKHAKRLRELEEKKKQFDQLGMELKELPIVNANLDALQRTLAIMQGEEFKPDTERQDKASLLAEKISIGRFMRKEDSMASIAYAVLKEAGEPLSPNDLFERVKAKREGIGKNSFLSGQYRLVRDKKRFMKNRSGKFGLIEWKEAKEGTKADG